METECKTSQLNGASDSSASETSEEPDQQDIAPNSPIDESRPKQCKTVFKVKVCASCKKMLKTERPTAMYAVFASRSTVSVAPHAHTFHVKTRSLGTLVVNVAQSSFTIISYDSLS